jgi:hypothetical protein
LIFRPEILARRRDPRLAGRFCLNASNRTWSLVSSGQFGRLAVVERSIRLLCVKLTSLYPCDKKMKRNVT